MNKKPQVCLVFCSVLKQELKQLKEQGKIDAELVFVSKNFHVDYNSLEINLRKILGYTQHTQKRPTRRYRRNPSPPRADDHERKLLGLDDISQTEISKTCFRIIELKKSV